MGSALLSLLRMALLAALAAGPAFAATMAIGGQSADHCHGAVCPSGHTPAEAGSCLHGCDTDAAGVACADPGCLAQTVSLAPAAASPDPAGRVALRLAPPGDLRLAPDRRARRKDRPPTA